MMLLRLSIVIVACAGAIVGTDERFSRYMARFGKSYGASERAWRQEAYERNMEKAAEVARRNPIAEIGETIFSDRTPAELAALVPRRKRRNDIAAPPRPRGPPPRHQAAIPPAVDWRTVPGVVGPIKNQGQCGSCWAFSAIANIESQWALAGHPHVALSEQQLVSCDAYDGGCDGGDTFSAWQWLIYHHRGEVAPEAAYPYVSGGGKAPSCAHGKGSGARVEGYLPLPLNETELASWTASNGPPSICLNADVLLHYKSGIITDCPNHHTDHCILIVGYDNTHSPPYWIVRNSWGTAWGERGYFRLKMYGDLCGMLDEPGSALVRRSPQAANATYRSCSKGCDKCDGFPVGMEDGVCSDGGSGWSMTATCRDAAVDVTMYAGPHCTGGIVVNTTVPPSTCKSLPGAAFKIDCHSP